MSVTNPYERYKQTQIETAGQGKLILMLYEGAIRNLKVASEYIGKCKIEPAHNALLKAQDIVQELDLSLNMDAGGDIAQGLRSLYQYMRQRLIEANIKKDMMIINEIIHLLTELKEAWDVIIRKGIDVRNEGYGHGTK